CAASVASLAQTAHRLHPAEGFLDALADPLTDSVPGMASGPRVERRTPRPREVLRHVWRDLEFTARGDAVVGVIALVPTQRDATSARQALIGHGHRGTPLGAAVGRTDLQIDDKGVSVIHHHIDRRA